VANEIERLSIEPGKDGQVERAQVDGIQASRGERRARVLRRFPVVFVSFRVVYFLVREVAIADATKVNVRQGKENTNLRVAFREDSQKALNSGCGAFERARAGPLNGDGCEGLVPRRGRLVQRLYCESENGARGATPGPGRRGAARLKVVGTRLAIEGEGAMKNWGSWCGCAVEWHCALCEPQPTP
jgi:hypothetical protein